jgi:hypothetical protein
MVQRVKTLKGEPKFNKNFCLQIGKPYLLVIFLIFGTNAFSCLFNVDLCMKTLKNENLCYTVQCCGAARNRIILVEPEP